MVKPINLIGNICFGFGAWRVVAVSAVPGLGQPAARLEGCSAAGTGSRQRSAVRVTRPSGRLRSEAAS